MTAPEDIPLPPEAPVPGPFSRMADTERLAAEGTAVRIEATEDERRALAGAFDILAISRLEASFVLVPWRKGGVKVTGTVQGDAVQACVVSLDPVEETIKEHVDLDFLPHDRIPAVAGDPKPGDRDPPEPFWDGVIDLGAIAAEYLALGLNPYPRKPGAVFEEVTESPPEQSPFAGLAQLRKEEPPAGG